MNTKQITSKEVRVTLGTLAIIVFFVLRFLPSIYRYIGYGVIFVLLAIVQSCAAIQHYRKHKLGAMVWDIAGVLIVGFIFYIVIFIGGVSS